MQIILAYITIVLAILSPIFIVVMVLLKRHNTELKKDMCEMGKTINNLESNRSDFIQCKNICERIKDTYGLSFLPYFDMSLPLGFCFNNERFNINDKQKSILLIYDLIKELNVKVIHNDNGSMIIYKNKSNEDKEYDLYYKSEEK